MRGVAAPGDVDVDARFLLANERTLLAWVRTGLTLVAVGGGLAQFGVDLPGRTAVSALLTGVGVVAAALGGLRYRAADRAIRSGVVPATGRAPYVLSGAVAVVGTVLLVALLLAG